MKHVKNRKNILFLAFSLLCISGCTPEKTIEVKEEIQVNGTSLYDSGPYSTAAQTAEHQFKYELSDKSIYTLKKDDFRVNARFGDYSLLLARVIEGRFDTLMIYEKKSYWMLSSSMDFIRDQSTKGGTIEGSLTWKGDKKRMTTKLLTNRHYTVVETRLKQERIPEQFAERKRTVNGLTIHLRQEGKQLNLAYRQGEDVVWIVSDRPEMKVIQMIKQSPDSPIIQLNPDFLNKSGRL